MASISADVVRDIEPTLFRYARRRVHSDEAARDLVQETWLAALGSYDSFAGRSSVSTWVTAILRRKIADSYRYRRPTEVFAEGHHMLQLGDAITRTVAARQEAEAVLAALDALTPREREAVELCGLEELDRDEVAARMGLSKPCLRVTLCRGRRRLREALGEDARG